ncbi:MAG: type I-E CRISPR-associated protein Cas6/Cse3/CasE [Gammaproteobacteria bacterium]|nr:type I-E CRISPR-associated protein Cas6/Cse3/CasE [Gammaproteobacteria bacterium]MCW5586644.1 type I-E CRISPR-associated protein Cas6/Cse3/CasE [Chromatiales bacterium]HOP16567.1 type I-E CRISPR-associated protein Cas6/Cse3/CasE [Gammaproteobacteria bacterium]
MALMLLHTVPDPIALTHWATRKRWLSPDGDLGYALHALLAEAFEGQAPTPFRYMNERGLLAYSDADEGDLVRRIDKAPPETQRLLGLDRLRLKPFPVVWPGGKRLGFEVRIRPIIRTKAGKERDLYQYRMEQRADEHGESTLTRESVYREWLETRLTAGNAARLVNATMHGFTLRQVVRRPHKSADDMQRKPLGVTGPDVLFRGELAVEDAAAFSGLISRGIGRHRAFGYGMLLLRPVRA